MKAYQACVHAHLPRIYVCEDQVWSPARVHLKARKHVAVERLQAHIEFLNRGSLLRPQLLEEKDVL